MSYSKYEPGREGRGLRDITLTEYEPDTTLTKIEDKMTSINNIIYLLSSCVVLTSLAVATVACCGTIMHEIRTSSPPPPPPPPPPTE